MAVSDAELADVKFHPRFDAKSRHYRYRLFCGQVRDPLCERLAWRVWPALDTGLLLETAALFTGRHDFGAFGSAPAKTSGTVRTVTVSAWHAVDAVHQWQFDVAADAFLYRMVRRLVFVQVVAAQGRCSRDALLRALESGVGSELPAGLAPPHGLELIQVDY
jgi:tRNA pseudouridine38-40 synthase